MILRWAGCKQTVRKQLLRFLPSEYSEYRDVTVGNGPMLPFVKGRITANDIHPALMDYYRRLQSCPRFIDEVLVLRELSRCPVERRKIFESMKSRYRKGDGLALVYLTRHAYREQVRTARRDTASFDPDKNGFRPLTPSRLLQCRATLQRVELVCEDYKSVMRRPGSNVVVVIDPPYHLRCSKDASRALYEYPWQSEEPYRELQRELVDCPHRFMLTVGDSDLEYDLFACNGWDVTEIPYATHTVKGSRNAVFRNHLLIRNYRDSRRTFWMFST